MHHDFETLHKSRSLQLFPMFRQLSLDQSALHITLPMSIWFSLYTKMVYRLLILPSKNRTPTMNSHSIRSSKSAISSNSCSPLFSCISTHISSKDLLCPAEHQNKFDRSRSHWCIDIRSCAPHTSTATLLSSTLTRKFPLGICQMLYQSPGTASLLFQRKYYLGPVYCPMFYLLPKSN